MRVIGLAALFACLLAMPARANPSNCAVHEPPPPSPRLVRPVVDGLSLNVLLPSDYATSDRRYPVLYLLHGGYYNENTWLRQTDVAEFTAPFTGDRAAIVVMPDGGPMGFYTDWHDGSQLWETYHLRRVIPYIDASFRTIADRAHRAIAGFSVGGFGAVHYAARHPDLFAAAGAFSGLTHLTYPEAAYSPPPTGPPRTDAGHPTEPAPDAGGPSYRPPTDAESGCGEGSNDPFGDRVRDAVHWHNHNPTDLASNLRSVFVYVSSGNGVPCGPEDAGGEPSLLPAVEPVVLDMGRRFVAALEAASVQHVADFQDCGLHTMRYAQRGLHAFWPHMFRAFGSPEPDTFDHRSADPQVSVWGWIFRADRIRSVEFLEVRNASRAGVTLTGSGNETVLTPPWYEPGQQVEVGGAAPSLARADGDGRVTLTVDLGPFHRANQFTLEAREYTWVTRRVRLKPRDPVATVLPRSLTCSRRRTLTVRVRGHRRRGERVVSVTVSVNGRRVAARRGAAARRPIRLRSVPRRAFRLRVVARTSRDRTLVTNRRYRACRPAGPHAAPRPRRRP